MFFSRDRERGQILSALDRYGKGVDTAPARKVIAAHRDALKDGDRALFEAALLVLGDKSRGPAAMKGAGPPVRDLNANERDVVNHGLLMSGCTKEEVTAGRACAAWK